MKPTLGNIAGLLGSVVTLAMVIPYLLSLQEHRYAYVVAYMVLLLLATTIGLFLHVRRYIRRLLIYLFTKSENMIVLERVTIYEFLARTRMRHEKRYHIQSNVNNLHEVSTRFGWSGTAELTPVPLNPDHKIVDMRMLDRMTHFTILLDRYYRKNEKLVTGFKIDDIDDSGMQSLMYLATGIFEKTRRVRLIVKLSDELKPRNIRIQIFRRYFDKSPSFVSDLTFDYEKRQISFEQEYPIYLSKYLLTWSLDE